MITDIYREDCLVQQTFADLPLYTAPPAGRNRVGHPRGIEQDILRMVADVTGEGETNCRHLRVTADVL